MISMLAFWMGGVASPSGAPPVIDRGAARRRRFEAPPKLRPEEIERQQRMTEEYLQELDRRSEAQSRAQTVAPEAISSPEPAEVFLPRLSAAMAVAATETQLARIVRSRFAAERDREVARAEFVRRYWVRAILLTIQE